MEFTVVIPARYASTRLPGKVLLDINGKPMLQHVYENALASGADNVLIATDDSKVADVAEKFGAKVCMTSGDHMSGTERIFEAIDSLSLDEEDIVVGLQADEPMLPGSAIHQLAEVFDEHDNVRVATLCEPLDQVADMFSPNIVKVILNRRNYALYFTRAAAPWQVEDFNQSHDAIKLDQNHYRHIGVYGYRVKFLEEYMNWSESPLEKAERLEQLRILWNGGRIYVSVLKKKILPGVDTQEDLDRVRAVR